jgi:TPR repeat protein
MYSLTVLNSIIKLWHTFHFSVGKLEDVENIAKVTDCLILYVAKGIALGCFVYARCLYRGHGMEKNEEKAINWFKRVNK